MRASSSSTSPGITLPVGLFGELINSTLLFGPTAAATRSGFSRKPSSKSVGTCTIVGVRKAYLGSIGREQRLRNNHLVARIEQRAKAGREPPHAAVCHEYPGWIQLEPPVHEEVLLQSRDQFVVPAGRGVVGRAGHGVIERRAADVRGGVKVRLPRCPGR
jgi:hypothetical protein